MNKRLKRFCLALIAPFVLMSGCLKENSSKFIMTAIITDINSHLEIEIIQDQYNSGILWVNVPQNAHIVNEKGEKLALSDLKIGQKIEICYSGQVMMSYPGQITARKINLLND